MTKSTKTRAKNKAKSKAKPTPKSTKSRRKLPKCPVLRRIRKKRGLASTIAGHLDIERSAVWMWKRVPAAHVIKVGQLLNIAKHRIRPDLYRG
jgi:hypothetical protein